MGKFNEENDLFGEEGTTILEIVRVVLSDGNLLEWVGNQTDLSNDALNELLRRVNIVLADHPEPNIDEDPNHHMIPDDEV